MKDELGGQFMKEVVGLRVKTYTRFFLKETRFPKQAQCFLKFFQFEPEMFLKCFL